ncbi:MAG: efflux RND transporter periplasmic adaptor subunit [Pseudomonadota bacterium]
MKRAMSIAIGIAVAAAAGAGGYFLGGRQSHVAAPPQKAADHGRKVLYWHDPMYPQQKFDKPGRSPFMNMDLVPVYEDEKAAQGGVAVSSRVRQSLGIRIAAAQTTELQQAIAAVGYVQADERRMARAEVRTQGWVERLHVRAVNEPVRAGQTLAEFYSPELYGAQEEYLLARRMARQNAADEPLARAARRRLELLGLPEGEIRQLEQSGQSKRRVPVLAPISGVVSELGVREGAMVQAGTPAFTLTDLSSVWLTIEVPEAQAAVLRQGQGIEARVQTLPGRSFAGKIDYIYPELNIQTRTVKARATLANSGLALKPGMFAQVSLGGVTRKALTVPAEAVIHTGSRNVVVVTDGERFQPTTVRTGTETDGRIEILSGLKEGERVVASGQFLIDSEASLRGALDRLAGAGEAKPGSAAAATHRGTGRITDLHIAKGRVELEHEAIASLKWPKMTMEFAVEDAGALGRFKRGDEVEFEVRGEPSKDGDYVLQRLAPRSGK